MRPELQLGARRARSPRRAIARGHLRGGGGRGGAKCRRVRPRSASLYCRRRHAPVRARRRSRQAGIRAMVAGHQALSGRLARPCARGLRLAGPAVLTSVCGVAGAGGSRRERRAFAVGRGAVGMDGACFSASTLGAVARTPMWRLDACAGGRWWASYSRSAAVPSDGGDRVAGLSTCCVACTWRSDRAVARECTAALRLCGGPLTSADTIA